MILSIIYQSSYPDIQENPPIHPRTISSGVHFTGESMSACKNGGHGSSATCLDSPSFLDRNCPKILMFICCEMKNMDISNEKMN